MDYDLSNTQRLWGRYTHDLSETRELGGLFFNTQIPGVAATDTRRARPGRRGRPAQHHRQQQAERAATISSAATTSAREPADGVRNTRSDFGVTIPEVFPENANGLIPVIDVTGLSTLGANQLFRIEYINHTFTDNFSWQRGNHAFKMGGLATFEQKNENAASRSQGAFTFVATDRRRHGVPELHARQPRRRRAPAAATPRPSATSTCTCASTASSSTRRTRGGRPRA